LWDVFGGFGEEVLQTAAEVEQSPRENGANSLKDKEPRTWIDVCVGLALESEAECDKKHDGEREILQTLGHVSSL